MAQSWSQHTLWGNRCMCEIWSRAMVKGQTSHRGSLLLLSYMRLLGTCLRAPARYSRTSLSHGECHGFLSAKWRVAGCSAGDCSKRCTPCGWLVLTKTAPCRVIIAKAVMTWQIMTRGLAQAGNRTSKTALCSQWWDCKLEWSVDASAPGNQCDCQLFPYPARFLVYQSRVV